MIFQARLRHIMTTEGNCILKKKKKILLLLLLAVAVCVAALYSVINENFKAAAEQYADRELKTAVTLLIEQTVLSYIEETKPSYEDFCIMNYSADGTLSSISVDAFRLNVFRSEVLLRINNLLCDSEATEFSVPWGNLTGSRWLSGKGFGVTARAVPLGLAAAETQSVFESTGINQSIHRINLEICVTVSLLTPFSSTQRELYSSVCIAETVIIGEVPDVYFGSNQS